MVFRKQRSSDQYMDVHFFVLIRTILYALKNDVKRAFFYDDLTVEAIKLSILPTVSQTILLANLHSHYILKIYSY
jgi:hypothetical protein